MISQSNWTRVFCFQFSSKILCIAELRKKKLVENEDKRYHPNGGVIVLSLFNIVVNEAEGRVLLV